MADNLSVSVTADTSDLRAQLALAQADLRAFGAETRALANSIRSGSDASGVLRGQLEQVAGQFNRAKGEVTGLTAALRDHKAANDNAATGLKGIAQAIEGATAPIAGLVGGLDGIAAALGAAFVAETVNRVIEFARSMAELGETTLKLAAATGQTPEEFSSMSAAMAIAGGNAETAARTMERLASNIGTALRHPSSKAADALHRLGITEAQLKGTNGSLEATLKLLADAFLNTKDSMAKTDAFRELLGRGFESLVQYLMRGSAGIDEFTKKAGETGATLNSTTIKALADTGEKMNTLGGASKALGANLVANLKPAIDTVTGALTRLISALNEALHLRGPAEAGAEQVEAINRRIAENEQRSAALRAGGEKASAGGYAAAGPYAAIGKAAGPFHGDELAQLDQEHAQLTAQRDQITEMAREAARGAAFATGPTRTVQPPAAKPDAAAVRRPAATTRLRDGASSCSSS